jgi:hypothetical protein
MTGWLLTLVCLLAATSPALADRATAIETGVIVCLQIDATGNTSDGFILKSSGDAAYDRDMLVGGCKD